MSESSSAVGLEEIVVTPKPRRRKRKERDANAPPKQPRYHVILWNDDDHTHQYVIEMMQKLFGRSWIQGYIIAREVDETGRAICDTTTLERAELKRDQIHAFGADSLIAHCKGAMWATIEAVGE